MLQAIFSLKYVIRSFLVVAVILVTVTSAEAKEGTLQRVGALPSLVIQLATPTPSSDSIDELLVQGKSYYEDHFWVSPPGKNALEVYQQVLQLDSTNSEARQYLRLMALECLAWATSADAQHMNAEAIAFYQRFLKIAAVLQQAGFASDLSNNIEQTNKRLIALGAGSAATPIQTDATPAKTAEPTAITSSTESSQSKGISDYIRRYQAGEDVIGELQRNPLFLPLVYGTSALLIILAAAALYLLRIRPARKRRPLEKALRLISSPGTPDLLQADDLIEQALISGLDKKDLSEARFAQIYVKAQLKRYRQALVLMQEFLRKNPAPDQPTIYLAIWLMVNEEEYAEVEMLYDKHSQLLGNYLDVQNLIGIAYLNLGRKLWEKRDVEGAVRCFGVLRKLEILTEYIPQHIDDHHIVLGINAIFDGNIEQARDYFNGALADAKSTYKSTLEAEIGLLVCEWEAQARPNIDESLGKIVETMDRSAQKVVQTNQSQRADLLLWNVWLWYCEAGMVTWFHLPEQTPLPENELRKVFQRIETLKKLNEKNPDAYLLDALLHYYFVPKKKEEAVQTMRKAITNGVTVAEVINLANREEKIIKQQHEALETFLQLMKKYLNDQSVPLALRLELKERLNRFQRFQQVEKEIKLGTSEDDAVPSILEIQNRSELLHKRVDMIVQSRLEAASETDQQSTTQKINELLEELQMNTRTLRETSSHLEKTEQALMLQTGEFLLMEEEPPTAEVISSLVEPREILQPIAKQVDRVQKRKPRGRGGKKDGQEI